MKAKYVAGLGAIVFAAIVAAIVSQFGQPLWVAFLGGAVIGWADYKFVLFALSKNKDDKGYSHEV